MAELLRKKPDARCDIIEALEHPFMQADYPLPTQDIMEEVLQSMMHFQSLNMLQKASITALAWRASDEETQHLRQIFESIDRDGNGFVTVEELRETFEKTGVNVPQDLAMLAASAGTDGNDTIEYTEFIAAAMDKKSILKEEVVWEAFKIFDVDGNGTVTKKELLKILTGRTSDKIRQVHGDKAIDNFLDEYDQTGDDVIDFDEFMGMLNSATIKEPSPLKKSKSKLGKRNNESSGFWLPICTQCSSMKMQPSVRLSARDESRGQSAKRGTGASTRKSSG